MGKVEKIFTRNETIALMHQDTAGALRRIADFIEKQKMGIEESLEWMREIADEKDAQAIVSELRDDLMREG